MPFEEGQVDGQLFIIASNVSEVDTPGFPGPLNQIVSQVWVATTVEH